MWLALVQLSACHLLLPFGGPAPSAAGADARGGIPALELSTRELPTRDLPTFDQSLPVKELALHGYAAHGRPNSHGQCLAVGDDVVFLGISDGDQGVVAFDTRDPQHPVRRGWFSTRQLSSASGDVLGATLDGTRLYLATYYGGLVVLDVSDLDELKLLGSVAIPSTESWAVAVRGNRAYVAAWSGIITVDLTDPQRPSVINALPITKALPCEIRILGERAYVGARSSNGGTARVLSLATPDAPALISGLDVAGWPYEVWPADGRYLYAADNSGERLLTIDVGPGGPTLMHATPPSERHRSLDGDGTTLYAAVSDPYKPTGRVYAYDLRSPASPVLVAQSPDTKEWVNKVRLRKGLVYASGGNGLWIFKPVP